MRPTALISAILIIGASAGAQTPVAGVVGDSTGRPLEGVEVYTGNRAAKTDAAGRFELRGVPGDPVRLRFRKVGLEPLTVQTSRDSASPGIPLKVTMGPMMTRLGRVVVEGQAYDRKLWENGFYQRQRSGRGAFLDSADVAFYAPAGLAAMARLEPRVSIVQRNEQQFALSTVAGRECLMHVYVDGMHQRVAAADPMGRLSYSLGLAQVIDISSIHAVEVYPTDASVPTRYRRLGSSTNAGNGSRIPSQGRPMRAASVSADPNGPCGAILIWTKPVYADSTSGDSR